MKFLIGVVATLVVATIGIIEIENHRMAKAAGMKAGKDIAERIKRSNREQNISDFGNQTGNRVLPNQLSH